MKLGPEKRQISVFPWADPMKRDKAKFREPCGEAEWQMGAQNSSLQM